MITVFSFSNQISNKSSNTSGRTIKTIIEIFPTTKNLEENEKLELIEKLQTPIRKLAHFSLYTIGRNFMDFIF